MDTASPETGPTGSDGQAPAGRSPALLAAATVVGVVLLGYALAAGDTPFIDANSGRPGVVTAVADLLLGYAGLLAATVTLGGIVFVLVVGVPDARGLIDARGYRGHLLVEGGAVGWALIAVAQTVFSAAARSGVDARTLLQSPVLVESVVSNPIAAAWCVAACCAALIAVGSRFAMTWSSHLVLAVPAVVGALAVPVSGNAAQGVGHDHATSAVIVFAAALFTLGGLKLARLLAPVGPADRRTRGIEVLAGGVALVFGLLTAGFLVRFGDLTTTAYGRWLLVAALAGAVALALDAAAWRRGGSRFDVPAAAVLTVVFAALAAMSARPAPRLLDGRRLTSGEIFLGYDLPGPPDVVTLLTVWRFDWFLGVVAIVFAAAYIVGLRRLAARGDRWPIGRTLFWLFGCLMLLVTSSSGIKAYGSGMFSVHMGEHMALNMFIPVLLVLGAPATLALRALPPSGSGAPPGLREWLLLALHSRPTRFFSHPLIAFGMFTGSLFAVYFTPLFAILVRYHWGHELMSVHFLVTGYVFYWIIIGVDPGPSRPPFLARLGLLFAVMPFHAFFGIATMSMTEILGGDFYRLLGLSWVPDLQHDQWLGGAIAWGSSEIPVVLVVCALVAQWARADRRAGARSDKRADVYDDDELDSYNRMLAELSGDRRQG